MARRSPRDLTVVKIRLHGGRTEVTIPVVGRSATQVVAELARCGVVASEDGRAIVTIDAR